MPCHVHQPLWCRARGERVRWWREQRRQPRPSAPVALAPRRRARVAHLPDACVFGRHARGGGLHLLVGGAAGGSEARVLAPNSGLSPTLARPAPAPGSSLPPRATRPRACNNIFSRSSGATAVRLLSAGEELSETKGASVSQRPGQSPWNRAQGARREAEPRVSRTVRPLLRRLSRLCRFVPTTATQTVSPPTPPPASPKPWAAPVRHHPSCDDNKGRGGTRRLCEGGTF